MVVTPLFALSLRMLAEMEQLKEEPKIFLEEVNANAKLAETTTCAMLEAFPRNAEELNKILTALNAEIKSKEEDVLNGKAVQRDLDALKSAHKHFIHGLYGHVRENYLTDADMVKTLIIEMNEKNIYFDTTEFFKETCIQYIYGTNSNKTMLQTLKVLQDYGADIFKKSSMINPLSDIHSFLQWTNLTATLRAAKNVFDKEPAARIADEIILERANDIRQFIKPLIDAKNKHDAEQLLIRLTGAQESATIRLTEIQKSVTSGMDRQNKAAEKEFGFNHKDQ